MQDYLCVLEETKIMDINMKFIEFTKVTQPEIVARRAKNCKRRNCYNY